MVERHNQGNDDTAEKDGRIADGGRDQAEPRNVNTSEEAAATFASACVEKAAHQGGDSGGRTAFAVDAGCIVAGRIVGCIFTGRFRRRPAAAARYKRAGGA